MDDAINPSPQYLPRPIRLNYTSGSAYVSTSNTSLLCTDVLLSSTTLVQSRSCEEFHAKRITLRSVISIDIFSMAQRKLSFFGFKSNTDSETGDDVNKGEKRGAEKRSDSTGKGEGQYFNK